MTLGLDVEGIFALPPYCKMRWPIITCKIWLNKLTIHPIPSLV